MRCQYCDREVCEDGYCPNCNTYIDSVKVLSRKERDSFKGVTIDSGGGDNKEYQQREGNEYYFKVKSFNIGSMGLAAKLLIAGSAMLLMMIALPLLFMFIIAGVVWWGLRKHR